MAANKKTQPVDEKEALGKVEPIAKLLGRTAGQIWQIFVKRYIAKGVAELFAATVITILTLDKLWAHHWLYWLCIPFPIVMLLAFDAIQLLINPAYFAMGDVENAIKRNTKKTNEVTIYNNR